jgi:hypothetical protein
MRESNQSRTAVLAERSSQGRRRRAKSAKAVRTDVCSRKAVVAPFRATVRASPRHLRLLVALVAVAFRRRHAAKRVSGANGASTGARAQGLRFMPEA